MAADAEAVLDHLGWDAAHVVGHSLGGVIAQQLALQRGERVRSLALLCTFARGRDVLSWSPAALWAQLRCRVGTRAMRRRAFFALVSPASLPADEANMATLEAAFGRGLADLPAAAMGQVRALAASDLLAELPGLRGLPALVVSASEDRLAPPVQGRLLAQALGVALHEVPGAHAVPVQDAARINALLADFLGGADARV
jgi:pimeloyl-ACP methyl ester carboxylesterase